MALKINMISAVLFTASLLVSSNLLAQWGGHEIGATNPSSNMTGMPGPAQGAGPTNPVGYGRPPMPMYDSTNPVGYGRPPNPYRSTNGTGMPGPAQGAGPTDPVGYGRPPMPYRSNGPQYGGWPISQGGN